MLHKIGNSAIDSVKIRIPIDNIKSYSTTLSRSLLVVESEGLMVGEDSVSITNILDYDFKKNSIVIDQHGAKTTYKYIQQNDFKTGSVQSFIYILVNSKILGADYMTGICNKTIKQVYKAIIAHGVINVSYMFFLRSAWSDCDIKQDFYCTGGRLEYLELLRMVKRYFDKAHPKEKLSRDQGYQSFTKEKNTGIEFSKRVSSNYLKIPYFKMYDKRAEFIYNSKEFNEHYSFFTEVSPLYYRIEAQLKNILHLRTYLDNKYAECSLKTLLDIDFDLFLQFCHSKLFTMSENRIIEKSTEKNIPDTVTEALMVIALKQYRDNHETKMTDFQIVDWLYQNYFRTMLKGMNDQNKHRAKVKFFSALPIQEITKIAYAEYEIFDKFFFEKKPTYDVGSNYSNFDKFHAEKDENKTQLLSDINKQDLPKKIKKNPLKK